MLPHFLSIPRELDGRRLRLDSSPLPELSKGPCLPLSKRPSSLCSVGGGAASLFMLTNPPMELLRQPGDPLQKF